jgi:hypothetical protein
MNKEKKRNEFGLTGWMELFFRWQLYVQFRARVKIVHRRAFSRAIHWLYWMDIVLLWHNQNDSRRTYHDDDDDDDADDDDKYIDVDFAQIQH